MAETYSMKDDFFNIETASYMIRLLKEAWPPLDEKACLKQMVDGFEGLELKERMTHVCSCLEVFLRENYRETVGILTKVMERAMPGQFIFGGFCEYIERHGCTDKEVDFSLETLGLFTKCFTAEFAIRRFINEYPEKTLEAMLAWSLSGHVDQRRLASEGLRPKLPWAKGISIDYKKAMAPLNNLYMDKERYVTRSVANHLNDVSKIDPKLVLTTLKEWQKLGKQDPNEMAYIIKHSTRTLVKKGHQPALALLGFKEHPKIVVERLVITTPHINIGEYLNFSVDLKALEAEKLLLDYVIEYPMANEKRATKVFKLKQVSIGKGQTVQLAKNHAFKQMTTKKLYTGNYKLTLQINGHPYNEGHFFINCDEL